MNEQVKKELLAGGIDIEGMYKRLPGMDSLIQRLLLKFPNEQCYSDLLEAMEQQDYRRAFEHAHNLKGVSANLEMHPLFEHVSSLVEMLRVEGNATVPEMEKELEEIKKDYETVTETIKRVLSENQ